jgi:hypothetical protein
MLRIFKQNDKSEQEKLILTIVFVYSGVILNIRHKQSGYGERYWQGGHYGQQTTA